RGYYQSEREPDQSRLNSKQGDDVTFIGSPSGMKDRTFQVTFKLPEFKSIARKKRELQNPVLLARQWRDCLDRKIYGSPAGHARHLHISRARVTQILNILKLPPEALGKIALFGEKLKRPINERQLRSLLSMNEVKQ
ncbi:MAG: hypothetical protein JW701_05000, partial [Kosmotogaceae bacterium]|nr:hypothetical protein [Kosmotogaceae bacterium]